MAYDITSSVTEPLLAQIRMFNLISEQRLNARFFIQNITQVDTYFSIKHWFWMQRALNSFTGIGTGQNDSHYAYNNSGLGPNGKGGVDSTNSLAQSHSALCFAKFQTILKLLKQWRVKQDLCHVVYPEVIDSVLLMLLAQLLLKQKLPASQEKAAIEA